MKPIPDNVIYYLAFPILVVFLLAIDVFNFAAKIRIDTLEYVRIGVIGLLVVILAYSVQRNRRLADLSIVAKLRYLLITVLLMFLTGVVLTFLLSPEYKTVTVTPSEGLALGSRVKEVVMPESFMTVFYTLLMFLVAMITSFVLLFLLRGLIFHKQRRSTSRFFMSFLIFGGLTVLTSEIIDRPLDFRFEGLEIITGSLLAVTTLLILVLSFRTSWIPYLSMSQKIAYFFAGLVIPGLMILAGSFSFSIWDILDSYSYLAGGVFYVMTIFLFTYSVKGVASLLLHLPTAAMFDKKVKELNSLNSLGSSMNSVFEFDRLKVSITELFAETLEADLCWLELFREDRKSLFVASKKSRNPDRLDLSLEEIDLSEASISAQVVKTGKPMIINQLKKDKRGLFYRSRNIGSLMAVPMVLYEEVVGILCAAKIMEFGFDQDDTTMFQAFANQATIAMENSRLIKASIDKERLEQELKIAQDVQKKLLPQKIPSVGFERNDMKLNLDAITIPANEVGGDYYDFVRISDWRIGLIIGDVSGKGTSASFYMAEIKGIIQALAPLYTSPSLLLNAVNEVVYKNMDRKSFISLIYADFDVSSCELTFARAGHCPPLHVSDNGTRQLMSPGMALGIDRGDVFVNSTREQKVRFKKDDVFVFYTDGVTEARNSSGQEFGEERLESVVASNRHLDAGELRAKIVEEVGSHCTRSHDDLTLVIAKVV